MARRKTWMRLVVGLAVVALGSTLFGAFSATPASGIVTTVTIAPKFQGVVNAQAPCQAGREVVLKKKRRPGKRPRNKVIGRTTSAADGSWAVPSDRQFGRYFAVAKASGGTGYGYGYGYGAAICEKGKSPILNLGRRP